VILLLAVFQLSPLRLTMDRAFFDAASKRPFRPAPIPPGSAIVLMDDATMEALSKTQVGGTWPPPRYVFAALMAGLQRAGASRIVMDFVFLDVSASLEQDLLVGALAAAIPAVSLGRTPRQTPVFWDEKFRAANAPLFASARMGNADPPIDSDGVIRRYEVQRSMASTAFNPSPAEGGGFLRFHGGIKRLGSAGTDVVVLSAAPFIEKGMHMVGRLSEKAEADGTYQPGRLAKALASEDPLSEGEFQKIRGRTVFVGASATGTFDQKPFAIGGLEPGVLVHWTAWSNLAGAGFIQPVSGWVPPLLALLLVAGLALTGMRLGGIVLPILIAVALAVIVLGGAYIGLSLGWFLPPATPVAAASLALIGVVAENFWAEHRRRREVQAMFGSYVAPEVVDMLVRDPAAIRLGGEKRDASVFFCDLAGFTDLSEAVTPAELLELINGYLQETSECLLEHGAYIDKYIGDAVMAVFGAPLALPHHALSACRGALAAQRILAERNKKLAVTHGRTLGMRIGINSGDMIMGNLGSARKINYTVLGDTVNLASRLEGANKEFGTSIMLGETTSRLVRDELVIRPLTGLRVKGKKTAVQVCELIGEKSDITPLQRQFLDAYGEGHSLYTSRRFAEAVDAFNRAAGFSPTDEMTQSLLEDAGHLAANPPPPDWQPVLTLKTK
jgi:adenylate cyclase